MAAEDINQKWKFDESDIERAVENIVKGLNSVQQAALKNQIEVKAAHDASVQNGLDQYKKVAESQGRLVDLMAKKYETLSSQTVKETEKQGSAFAGLFTKLKSGLSLIGSLTGIGTVANIIRGIGNAVGDMVSKFAATKEGSKALEGINLQWAKMKAVAGDFLENALKKIIPILNVVLPYIEKGFRQVTGVVAGIVAFYKASYENVFNGIKILFNDVLIGYNLVKEKVLGDKGAGEKVKELRAENARLEGSFVDAGKAAVNAYNDQIKAADKASAGAKVVNEATKEQIAAIKKLRDEYAKLLEELSKKVETTQLENIVDPFKKLAAERDFAIKQVDKLRDDIIEHAKQLGKPIPVDLDAQINILREPILNKYREELAKLVVGLRKIDIEELATEKNNLNEIISDGLRNAFNVPQSVFDEAKKVGVDLTNIAGYIFASNDAQKVLQEGLDKNEKDTADKINKHVKRTQELSDKITQDASKKTKNKNLLAGLLGIDDQEGKLLGQAVNKAFQSVNAAILDGINAQIKANDAQVAAIHNRVTEAESALAKEEELQRSGAANNVESKRKELDALNKEEERARAEGTKLKKKALAEQLIVDELSQASSLIVAEANILASETKSKGLIGLAIGIAGIITMIALFASFKAKAKAAAADSSVKAYKGGKLEDYQEKSGWVNKEGRTDKRGGRGHRVEDSNLVLGGKEFVTNEDTATRHGRFLEAMNKGKYDGLDLFNLTESVRTASTATATSSVAIDKRAKIAEVMKKQEEEERLVSKMKAMGDVVTGNAFLNNKRKFLLSIKKNANLVDNAAILSELRAARMENEKRRESEYVTAKQMQDMFEKQTRDLKKQMQEAPMIIPLTEGTNGYRIMTPKLTETIYFEKKQI